jgi:integrase
MTNAAKKTPAGMKGGVRRPRGPKGTWSFTIYMGLQDAQRCVECKHRVWVGPERLDVCPKCDGAVRDSRERRQVVQGGYQTQGDAKLAHAKALTRVGKGTYIAPQRKTVAEFLSDEWLPAQERRVGDDNDPLKATTLQGYRLSVREHLIGPPGKPFPLGLIELRKLTRAAIREHYSKLGESYFVERKGKLVQHPGLGVESRRRVHACLHKALNDAKERGYIGDNPAWKAMKAKKNSLRFEGAVWTADELGAFLAATAETELFPLWYTIATTGLRRGEACGLRWSDIDLTKAQIIVSRSRVPVGGDVIESSPKGGQARIVDLDEDTLAVLEQHRKAQIGAQLKAGPKWQGTGNYIFTRADGRPIEPNSVSRAFRLAVAAAGQRRIRLHDLRHTHASLLLADGEPIGNVSRRIGHADSNITAQVYEHYVPGAQKATATRFQNILKRAKNQAN